MSVYTENNEVKKSPSNTSFELLLSNTKSNMKLEINNLDFYTGNRKKTTEKILLVPKKFQSNF